MNTVQFYYGMACQKVLSNENGKIRLLLHLFIVYLIVKCIII